MEDDKFYELWDKIIDFVLILLGFVIAILIYLGVPHG